MSQRQRPKMVYDHKPKAANAPNVYGGVNKGPGPGVEFGGAAFSGGGKDERTGLYGSADIGYLDGYAGGRSDGRFGVGGRVGLQGVKGGWEGHGVYGEGQFGVLKAEADAHIGENSTGFALGADLVSGGIEGGTRNPESSTDEAFGISASISSPGASAHLLYGDSDGDGYREYGFDVGGKLGPGVGLKFTTEDPLRTALKANPLTGAAANFIAPDTNLTGAAGNAASSAANWVGEKASSAWGGIKSFFGGD